MTPYLELFLDVTQASSFPFNHQENKMRESVPKSASSYHLPQSCGPSMSFLNTYLKDTIQEKKRGGGGISRKGYILPPSTAQRTWQQGGSEFLPVRKWAFWYLCSWTRPLDRTALSNRAACKMLIVLGSVARLLCQKAQLYVERHKWFCHTVTHMPSPDPAESLE